MQSECAESRLMLSAAGARAKLAAVRADTRARCVASFLGAADARGADLQLGLAISEQLLHTLEIFRFGGATGAGRLSRGRHGTPHHHHHRTSRYVFVLRRCLALPPVKYQ